MNTVDRAMLRDEQVLIYRNMHRLEREEEAYLLLGALVDCAHIAIRAGDWKIDGACDPDKLLRDAESLLMAENKWIE